MVFVFSFHFINVVVSSNLPRDVPAKGGQCTRKAEGVEIRNGYYRNQSVHSTYVELASQYAGAAHEWSATCGFGINRCAGTLWAPAYVAAVGEFAGVG